MGYNFMKTTYGIHPFELECLRIYRDNRLSKETTLEDALSGLIDSLLFHLAPINILDAIQIMETENLGVFYSKSVEEYTDIEVELPNLACSSSVILNDLDLLIKILISGFIFRLSP